MAHLDIHEIARLLGRHERTIRRDLAKGRFPRPTGQTRQGYLSRDLWNRKDVMEWMNRREGRQDAA